MTLGPALGSLALGSLALGTVCLLAGLHHLGTLATRRAPVLPAAAHAAMGLGMAAMFLPSLDPVPRPGWVAVFVVSGAWSAVAAWRAGSLVGEPGHLVVGAGAMLFMLIGGHEHAAAGTVDPEHAHPAAGPDGAPALLVTVLALLFAGWFVAEVVRTVLDRTDAAPTAGATATQVRTRVTASAVAHLAMSVAMTVMLLGMT